ncbi:hypothetical protein DH2020_040012 [Rehmannia glutinosa]|uniref:Phosphatidylinositol 4-phosphate 5-kinase n=1 Tax=Rehmannia glutinosa TaxID=99300 RepID=A0ABR0UWC9_REHGL
MSGPVAIVNDVERSLSLSDRTKSLDSVVSNDKTGLAELNGDVSHASSETNSFRFGEISLPNGECYYGSLLGNKPEGYGEFSGGYMHGSGTYTKPDRTKYKGRWRLNLKHGLGNQNFPNGDVFEGSWILGAPEGPGKYIWANGNVYLGNMKGGKMSGKGTLTWINGDSYEGSWFNGTMHGFGIYTWIGGGCYVGTWTRGLKDGKGTFYPKGSKFLSGQQSYLNALTKRGLLPDLRRQSQIVNVQQPRTTNVSLERRWSLEVSIEKVLGHDRSSSVSESVLEGGDNEDEMETPILEREYMQGVLISELVLSNRFSPSSRRAKRREKRLAREIKRVGEQIIKGHRSYDLMLSLQLGIRYTVGKITPIHRREVRATDFGSRASFWMTFPKEGSQLTPPHQSDDFKWKDYCPMVFRNLREMFKIDAADYMMSICGNDALRELSSPGKSGSVLLRMLPNYHLHVRRYDNTLITKFFGLHRIKPPSGQKFRFVVMGNMFCTELRIHRRFDLKGSSLGRSVDKVEIDENTILKDLDLNYCFYLEPSWRDALLQQIEIDSKFLESQHIMDYSLLLGVHYRAPQHLRSLMSYNQRMSVDGLGIVAEDEVAEDEISPQGLVLVPVAVTIIVPLLQIQLGVNMPARAEHIPGRKDATEMFHEVYDVVLYLGIIDILQEYNMSKKIEHAYKSIQFDSVSISAVDPTFYSERFLEFIKKVFPPNAVAG